MSESTLHNEQLQRRIAELEAELEKERDARRRADQSWLAILANIPDYINVIGLDMRLQYINKTFPGIKMEEAIGTRVHKWLPPESHAITDEMFSKVVSTLEPQEYTLKGLSPDMSPGWWHIRLGPVVVDGELVALTYISTEITRLKRAEEALQQKAAELARSNEELRQFAYVASHDMNQPLRTVTSYLELLRRRHGEQLGGAALEFIDFALGGAQRLRAIVGGLLEYTRVGSNAPIRELVDLGQILDIARQDLKAILEEAGVELCAGKLPKVSGDRTLLLRLMENLLANAIKFRAAASPRVEVSSEREEDAWRITVRDNGIGIEPSHLPRLFQLFQRLNAPDSYEGSGLGLSISRKIVERHGGRIWAESAGLGQGTAFHFTLPAA